MATNKEQSENKNNKLGREALIEYFSSGKMPTAKSFQDFINSTFNLRDDSLNISKTFGYELKNQKNGAFISFFENDNIVEPLLKIVQKKKEEVVMITNKEEEPVLQIGGDGTLVFSAKEEQPIRVEGTLGLESRIGIYKKGTAKADGRYHEVLEIVDNKIQVFEIVACLNGPPNTGKNAAMHAIAIGLHKHSWFNRIRQTNAFFAWPWNRLKLKWRLDHAANEGKGSLKLYIKTRSNYWKKNREDDFFDIQYHVTKLWNNQMTF